ncbi:Ankyrin repeat-containing domain [Trypanosoma melophagium]|uniref:Ankyrin repeat-containing domain n=1 Tax=Trypanosoma melophagium TaxID=715481 RepID=UPI00351A18BC|nr:Ankyrin repeat-containing domain [Trypanosoma melophagium]
MKSTAPAPIKPVIWKERITSSNVNYDEEMQHVVELIKSGKDDRLLRWIEVCDSINNKDSGGNTVLHWAASLGSLPAVTRLLFAGADVKAENQMGATPLHCAAVGGHSAVMEQLLRHGADALAQNNDGQTMFDLLRFMGWGHLSMLYNNLECALLFSSCDCQGREQVNFTREASLGVLTSPVVPGETPVTRSSLSLDQSNRICDSSSQPPTGADGVYVDEWSECLWGLALEVLCADEAADRQTIVNEYLEWALQVVFEHPSSPPSPPTITTTTNTNSNNTVAVPVAAVSQPVVSVLGERHAGESRNLLVRLQNGEIVWAAAEEVANEAVVRKYTDRLNQTSNSLPSTPTNINSNSTTTYNLFYYGDTFGYTERVELSRQLAQLPHGRLPSTTSTQYVAADTKEDCNTPRVGLPSLQAPQVRRENLDREPFTPQRALKAGHYHCEQQEEQQQEGENLSPDNIAVNRGLPKLGYGKLFHENMADTLVYPSSSDVIDGVHGGINARGATVKKANIDQKNGKNYAADGVYTTEMKGKSDCKLPPIRQELSHDEKLAYEKFLRESALRYLKRKIQSPGLQY